MKHQSKYIFIICIIFAYIAKMINARTADTQYVCNSSQFWDGIQCIDCSEGCSCNITKIEGACDACISGYLEYNPKKITFPSGQVVCKNCSPECGDKCCFNYDSNVQVCQNCQTSYYLNGWFCSQCLDPNCLNCSTNGVCITCKQGYFLNTIGICQPCVGSNCISCNSSGSCSTCPVGYYPDSTSGSCLVCSGPGSIDQNCLYCQTANKLKCAICSNFFYVDGQGKCREVAFCDQIEPIGEKCDSCGDGYYQDVNGKCKLCGQFGVSRCSSATSIIQCQNNRALTQDKSQCVYRIKHCTQYSNAGLCTQCDTKFSWNNKGQCLETCQIAIPNCTTCSNGNDTTTITCTTCNPGYFPNLTATQCISCGDGNRGGMQGCMTCTTAPFACSACNNGYFLNASNVCKGCTPDNKGTGCKTCLNATTCQTCLTNTFNNGGACNLCDVSCGQCTDLGFRNCQSSCSSNLYYLDKTTFCQKCLTSIAGCTNCSSKTVCTLCQNSYYLSTDPQYTSVNQACQLFSGCKIMSPGNQCLLCQPGYKMAYQGCVECQTQDCMKTCTDTPQVVVIISATKISFSLLIFAYILFLL